MSTVTPEGRGRTYTAPVVGGVVALTVVATVAVGGNYLWQRSFGPATATKADCALAQELIDEAGAAPSDPARAKDWEQDLREVRDATFGDEELSLQVGKYLYWARVKATGVGSKPTAEQFGAVADEARAHCRESGVSLVIPAL
jgi:hypothetical protein